MAGRKPSPNLSRLEVGKQVKIYYWSTDAEPTMYLVIPLHMFHDKIEGDSNQQAKWMLHTFAIQRWNLLGPTETVRDYRTFELSKVQVRE